MSNIKATKTTSTLKSTATLPALPAMPAIRRLRACACGCGGTTQRTFVPGHDARSKSIILRVATGVMTWDEVEAWGGKAVRDAQERMSKDAALMARWNVEFPEVEAEAKVG